MNAPFNTPQAVATELLRVDQLRRLREQSARAEALRLFRPLHERRMLIEAARANLDCAENIGAYVGGAIEAIDDALTGLQLEIDETFRQVALRHRLFVDDDATESFDEVDVDAILPAAEAARRRMRGGR